MKKFGFTLAEVLITLAVVGVVSALTAPMISNLIPDKDKINVLKTYNKIATLTQNLLEDPTYYYPVVENGVIERAGLLSPTDASDYDAVCMKYPNNLSNLIIEKDATEGNAYNYYFECAKDIQCEFDIPQSKLTMDASFGYDFSIILLYKKKTTHCSYSANCPKPDKFDFDIDNWGSITPKDPLSKAFLLNQLNMNQKKEDYAKAKAIMNGQ